MHQNIVQDANDSFIHNLQVTGVSIIKHISAMLYLYYQMT